MAILRRIRGDKNMTSRDQLASDGLAPMIAKKDLAQDYLPK